MPFHNHTDSDNMTLPSYTLQGVLKQGYLLAEIRHYQQTGVITMLFVNPNTVLRSLELSVPLIKRGASDCRFDCHGKYTTLLELVTQGPIYFSGYLDQRPGVVQILAKYFLHINIAVTLQPYDFALCCYDIYKHSQNLIASSYVSEFLVGHLTDLDAETNLTPEQLEKLEDLHCSSFPPKDRSKGKNQWLTQHLYDQVEDFHAEHAVKFCEDTEKEVKEAVRKYLPVAQESISFAGPKSVHRIKQKYEEYFKHYLQPGIHAYKRFKDLFRASITYDAYIQCLEKNPPPANAIAEINYRKEGNYKACYVILNIYTLNFELKIVKSLEADEESHEWYELMRHNSIENLEEFIRRGIPRKTKVPPRPKIEI